MYKRIVGKELMSDYNNIVWLSSEPCWYLPPDFKPSVKFNRETGIHYRCTDEGEIPMTHEQYLDLLKESGCYEGLWDEEKTDE